jgi:tRNA pseudouridine55 synthase
MMNFEEGELLLVDKPLNWTSFDVVAKIRNLIKVKKVGHGGTLDPLATGLLIIATGKKTKMLQDLQNADKSYRMTLCLGATTPSYDAEYPPENILPTDHLTEADIIKAFDAFRGTIEQFPPAFSAIKTKGKAAYALARKGIQPELQPRTVTISKLELIAYHSPQEIIAEVDCSKGTYIRSLAHDIGQYLGVGGYLKGLIRTRIGAFRLEDAWRWEELLAELKALRNG